MSNLLSSLRQMMTPMPYLRRCFLLPPLECCTAQNRTHSMLRGSYLELEISKGVGLLMLGLGLE